MEMAYQVSISIKPRIASSSINSEMCVELICIDDMGEWYTSTYVSNIITIKKYWKNNIMVYHLVYGDDISYEYFYRAQYSI